MDLFRSTVENLAKGMLPTDMLSRLHKAANHSMLVYPAQHTVIDVENMEGDAEVTFLFEASNFGFAPISSGLYPFWFDHPQEEVPFQCSGIGDESLYFEVARSSPDMREIRLFFQKPLQTLERTQLRISFRVRKLYAGDCFCCLRPRALANWIGLTVIAPKDVRLINEKLTRESIDGFLNDDSPDIKISDEGNRMKLHWVCRSPRSDDLFRTSWSYFGRDSGGSRVSTKNKVIRLEGRRQEKPMR